MTKCFSFIICSLVLILQACHLFAEHPGGKPQIRWQTSYDEAVKMAKANSKPIVMLFTGSDWCTWCTKLEEEALGTQDFAAIAGSKFVFLKLDYPLYSAQDAQTKEQNKELQKKFDVRSYPTVLIYDPQNNQTIGSTGYRPGGGKQYADHLLKYLNDYSGYKQKVSLLDRGSFSGSDLRQLYEQALKYNLQGDVNKIISVGVDSDKSLYFLTERYRLLAEQGQIHTSAALTLRGQLLTADPTNEYGIPYQIALIDYETYSKEISTQACSPELAVSPLNSYLEKYGSKDKENAWRLEMIISQVYLDSNQMSNALKHAQMALDAAPAAAQPEIARAIKSLRNQVNTQSLITRIHS